ncbi:MAG: CpaF family protein [Candidatus Loosdrechtia sp.]|uniref:CpaF family protein n=1 Tax=Candidatus Loosdrechtia sp. TaxID=3101272 RepID=UPI003A6BC9DF|nr:MAG: CpaF family protein [Candidatus Jettenia sp. AMX2]
MPLLKEGNGSLLVENEFQELKAKVHDRLVEVLDLSLVHSVDQDVLKYEIKRVIERILSEERRIPFNAEEKEQFCREVQDEVLGLGPLEPLMHDPTVTDVLVNTYQQIYVERHGRLELTGARFRDDTHLKNVIDRIVSAVGRRIDESCPMVDARLPDGSRVNAVVPPLAIDGPMLSIRRFAVTPLELEDLITLQTLNQEVGELLKGLVAAKLNILISGGTGTGKTTMLNVLSRFIPSHERIITIEDSAELQLKQEHVVRLETRPPNVEGKGEVTQRDLVKNSLRMRPDRIILGEIRSVEVIDMLQALNTGHEGSITTIHANTPRDALLRLETLVAMAGLNIPNEAIRKYISSALQIIIQVSRLVDGSRKIMSIQEVIGMEGNIILLQEIFSFKQQGLDEKGKVKGHFEVTRIMPKFLEKFHALGVPVPRALFDPAKAVSY